MAAGVGSSQAPGWEVAVEPIPETRSALEELDAVVHGSGDLAQSLQAAIDLAMAGIPDCVGASISVLDADLTFTFVSTEDFAGVIDATQYLDDGPCQEAIHSGEEIEIGDVLDEDRWQLFSQTSAAQGVRSSLSLPLRANGSIFGSVNLYGAGPATFTGVEVALARTFGARMEEAVSNADLSMATMDRARQAPEVLANDATVNQAMGVLVAQHDITFDQAGERLRDAATRAGVTQVDIASSVIQSMISQRLTLTDFLLARITEDEVLAHEVLTWLRRDMERRPGNYPAEYDPNSDTRAYAGDGNMGKPELVVGPARVLAECEAKRRSRNP